MRTIAELLAMQRSFATEGVRPLACEAIRLPRDRLHEESAADFSFRPDPGAE